MSLFNCKVELEHNREKHCVLSTSGNHNADDDNSDKISFDIKDIRRYFPVVTSSAKKQPKTMKTSQQSIQKIIYWNECKTKSKSKIIINNRKYFFESSFLGVSRFFILVCPNDDGNSKML